MGEQFFALIPHPAEAIRVESNSDDASTPAYPSRAERETMVVGVRKLLYKLARDFEVPECDREDIVADVQLKLWEISEKFDLNGSAQWSWFSGQVAKTMLRKWREKVGKGLSSGVLSAVEIDDYSHADPETLEEPDDGDDDDLAGHAGTVTTAIRRQLAGPALDSLTPGARKLVEQVIFDRLTPDQIAEQTGQPAKVVRTNLQLALGQLAKAGHLPPALATRFGFDHDSLVSRVGQKTKNARTAARRELVAQALTAGLSPREITAQLGESPSAISRDVKWIGAVRPKSRAELRRARVGELLAAGMTRAQIAAEVGISIVTVRDHIQAIRRAGAAGKPSKAEMKVRTWPEDMPVRDRVHTLAGEGMGFDQIAAELSITLGTAELYWRSWNREQVEPIEPTAAVPVAG